MSVLVGLVASSAGLYWYIYRVQDETSADSQLQTEASVLTSVTPVPNVTSVEKVFVNPQNLLLAGFGKLQTGDFEGAILWFRQDLKVNKNLVEAQSNLAIALLSYAQWLVEQGQYVKAESCLEEAVQLGSTAAKRLKAALTAKVGNTSVAHEILKELYEETKDSDVLSKLIKSALEQDALELARQEIVRFRNELTQKAAREPNVDHNASWAELNSFERSLIQKDNLEGELVRVDGNRSTLFFPKSFSGEFVTFVNSLLQELWSSLAGYLGELPASTKITIRFIPQENFYNDTSLPVWVGGLFNGTIKIPVPSSEPLGEQKEHLARVLKHEATHAYFQNFCGSTMPTWVQEGLAQNHEGTSFSSSLFALKSVLGSNFLLQLDATIMDSTFVNLTGQGQVQSAYAASRILTRFLLKGADFSLLDVLNLACNNEMSWRESLVKGYTYYVPSEIWKSQVPNIEVWLSKNK